MRRRRSLVGDRYRWRRPLRTGNFPHKCVRPQRRQLSSLCFQRRLVTLRQERCRTCCCNPAARCSNQRTDLESGVQFNDQIKFKWTDLEARFHNLQGIRVKEGLGCVLLWVVVPQKPRN